MARDFELEAILRAKDEASPVIERSRGVFSRFSSFLADRFVVTLGDLTNAFRGAISLFDRFRQAAQESENASTKLEAALAPLGPAASGIAERLKAQAAALQSVTKFGDDAIVSGQALLASFTKNEEQIKAATVAATNLAAATGIDLNSAFLLLGKAAAGATETLGRYGIILDEGIPAGEKFAAALERINEQFGGQAQAQAQTFSGLLAQIGNAFNDLEEVVGGSLTANAEFRAEMAKLRDLLADPSTVGAVTKLAEGIASLAASLAQTAGKLPDFALGLSKAATELATNNAAVSALAKILEPLTLLISASADGYKTAAEAITAYGAATRELSTAQTLLAEQERALNAARGEAQLQALGLAEAERTLVAELTNASAVIETASATTLTAAERFEQMKAAMNPEQARALEQNLRTLTAAVGDQARAVEILVAHYDGAARAAREVAEATGAWRTVAAELGLTLEADVNAKVERYNAFLIEAERLARAGAISDKDLANAKRLVAVATAEATDALLGETSVLSESTAVIEANTAARLEAAGATRELVVEINNLAVAEASASSVSGSGVISPGLGRGMSWEQVLDLRRRTGALGTGSAFGHLRGSPVGATATGGGLFDPVSLGLLRPDSSGRLRINRDRVL